MSCQFISSVKIPVFSSFSWQQANKVGNRIRFRSGWEKYTKGRLHSCCRTDGCWPLCTITWNWQKNYTVNKSWLLRVVLWIKQLWMDNKVFCLFESQRTTAFTNTVGAWIPNKFGIQTCAHSTNFKICRSVFKWWSEYQSTFQMPVVMTPGIWIINHLKIEQVKVCNSDKVCAGQLGALVEYTSRLEGNKLVSNWTNLFCTSNKHCNKYNRAVYVLSGKPIS